MPSTFDENKQSCKEYLQKIIDYNYEGSESHIADALTILQSECSKYLQNFEARRQTVEELREINRLMENAWDTFCDSIGIPTTESWEESMLFTLTSCKNACIQNLNQMGGKPLTAQMLLSRLRDI